MLEPVALDNAEYFRRIAIVFAVSVGLFFTVARVLGAERKAKWFKKRTRYTIFTRRSMFGEYIHFGRPCTWEGLLVFVGIFSFIFSFGYWYVFLY